MQVASETLRPTRLYRATRAPRDSSQNETRLREARAASPASTPLPLVVSPPLAVARPSLLGTPLARKALSVTETKDREGGSRNPS